MTTIVYIVGMGRSGSTLLDIALGQSPAIQSCGELSNIAAAVAGPHPCSCGKLVPECSFWSRIVGEIRIGDVGENAKWSHARRFSSWFLMLFSRRAHAYVGRLDRMYGAISRFAGRDIVVDSSKSPLRLALLLRWSGCEVRTIHLVKDPSVVAESLAAPIPRDPERGVQQALPGKPRIRSYLAWAFANALSELVLLFMSPRRKLRVRYEDFIADPEATAEGIGRFLELGESPQAPMGSSLAVGHLVAGNRMRMGEVRIRRVPAVAALRKPKCVLCEWLTLPLRARYHYLRSGRP